jgi:DNA-binding NarL/FixJ family response regulator
MSSLRVLVAPRGVEIVLGAAPNGGIEIVGHAVAGNELSRLARLLAPDGLLLAPPLPGPPLSEMLPQVRAERSGLGILLLVPADGGLELLTLPAVGLAAWDEAPGDLADLLWRLADGDCGMGPRLLQRLAGAFVDLPLTPRGRELLALLCLGWELACIARALSMKREQSARNLASQVYERLEVRSRAEAVARYGARLREGWDG